MSGSADIGMIGLAVMGQNLVLNMADHGHVVCVYNRTTTVVDKFLQDEKTAGKNIIGAHTLEEFVNKLKRPRKAMILVKAGKAVDIVLESLLPLLEPGDVVIDGGNSEYQDTERRFNEAKCKSILYIGMGVSGGEEGARYGPSLMPGGDNAAWPLIKPIFQAISAKVNISEPCCDWVGLGGAGHFVKMVHNGIEYGDMQIICEAYHIMKDILNLGNEEMSKVFENWNKGELNSFLIEITSDILKFKDTDGGYLVEKIRDNAGQKGTGKWTAIEALNFGVPVTLIAESVFARCLSSLIDERKNASITLKSSIEHPSISNSKEFIEYVRQALYASKIVSYAQGFMLLKRTSEHNEWDLNYGNIAAMWRGGCIIRSAFLNEIKNAFDTDPSLKSLLLAEFFKKAIFHCEKGWRTVISEAVKRGIPTPAFSAALAFFDGYRSQRLPANLLQAQRDYFGAHTYELTTNPGVFVHTNWTGRGGDVSASTYQA